MAENDTAQVSTEEAEVVIEELQNCW